MTKTKAMPQPSHVELDLASMPEGRTYEDRYRGYLEIFYRIAVLPPEVAVTIANAPASWVPLLWHLNCKVTGTRNYFDYCANVQGAMRGTAFDRTTVEVLCSFRPETADALWKIDMQWPVPKGRARIYPRTGEFIVTTNGAFHRPEVLDYLKRLEAFMPQKQKVCFVPCAADKPYPAPLHAAVKRILPNDYYIACATGVLGIVPEDLWPEMPQYDSGIPNEWRLYMMLVDYFVHSRPSQIIVYSDFYSLPIKHAIERVGYAGRASYAVEPQFYADYIDLMSDDNLRKLAEAVRKRGDEPLSEPPPVTHGEAVADDSGPEGYTGEGTAPGVHAPSDGA